jgi:hypothetical protein
MALGKFGGFLSAGIPGLFKGIRKPLGNFLTGTPEKRENVSTLRPEQEGLYQQLENAGQNQGAGGAFGDTADYYRNLISDDSADYNSFAAPQLRQFNEQTIPGLSEQFAGMGSGGLSSSGFRNAAIGAGTDLSERLGSIRASLRQQGAQGLQGIGQAGLGNYSQNMVTQQGSPGLLSQIGPAAVSTGIGYATGGPAGGASGLINGIGNMTPNRSASTAQLSGKNTFGGNKVGMNTSPYGGG